MKHINIISSVARERDDHRPAQFLQESDYGLWVMGVAGRGEAVGGSKSFRTKVQD